MAFRVEISDRAKQDLDLILEWLTAHEAGDAGLRWFRKMREAIGSLSELPHRCPLAPEMATSPTFIASFSRLMSLRWLFFKSDTVDAGGLASRIENGNDVVAANAVGEDGVEGDIDLVRWMSFRGVFEPLLDTDYWPYG